MTNVGEWPYAEWGMTADQIIEASGGNALKVEGEEQTELSGAGFTTLATAVVESLPFVFDVSFRAHEGETTLSTIRLELRDPDLYEALRNSLTAEYGVGRPVPADPPDSIECTQWLTDHDTITLKRLMWPDDLGVDVALDFEMPARRGR